MKVREEQVAIEGARLWTARQGSGRPVMLCSGGPGCCDYLEPVARMIDDLGEILRFEQRGCGRSSPDGPYDVETCVSDLEALRSHFAFERWTVGGHSWGADLALLYALHFPRRVDAILYLCGHGFHDDRGWSEAYHRERDARGEREPDYAYAPNLEVNRVGNRSFRRAIRRPTLLRDLAELRVPALIVCAGRDIRPRWPAEQLAHLLPSARLVTIAEAEHSVWLTHPEALEEHLRVFLGAGPGTPSGSETRRAAPRAGR